MLVPSRRASHSRYHGRPTRRQRPTALSSRNSVRGRPRLEELEPRQLLSLTINATFDSSITSDPQAATIEATINRTVAAFESSIADNITVAILFKESTTGLGGSSKPLYFENYQDYYNALVSHKTSANDTTAIASLPNQAKDPVNNNSQILVAAPLARALGFNAPGNGGAASDGTITLNASICNLDRTSVQDPTKYDLQAVTAHEIDECLAGGSALDNQINGNPTPTGDIQPLDLFRYSAAGTRSFDTKAATISYFSIDGGTTSLVGFNQYAPDANHENDFGDWFSNNGAGNGAAAARVQDSNATPGATPNLGVELTRLDVLGFTLNALNAPVVTAPTDQTAVEGSSKSFSLGSFTDPDAAPWGVTVSWGDGSPDTSFFLNTAGSLGAKPHLFAEEGNHTIKVTVTDFTSQTQTKAFQVNVSDPAVVAAGVPVFATACSSTPVAIATFTDPGGAEPNPSDPADGIPSHYKVASIDWGDGTPLDTTSGAISFGGTPGSKTDPFTITGSHSYQTEGSYTITAIIDHEGVKTKVTTTAVVKDKLGLLLLNSLSVRDSSQVSVTGDCGAIVVDSSADDAAASILNNARVTAGDFDVTGGVTSGSFAVVPSPVDHEAPTPDPLGLALPSPLPPAPVGNTTTVFHPGTYVGGLHIGGRGPFTLLPGVYVMEGGGFTVQTSSPVSGSGVVIINAPVGSQDVISFIGATDMTLSAPTSGPYRGVALFQAPASNNPINIVGIVGARLSVAGVIYAPAALVNIFGSTVTIDPGAGTATSPPIFGALIASDLLVQGDSRLVINPDDPPASPLAEAGGTAVGYSLALGTGGLTGPGAASDQATIDAVAISLAGDAALFGGGAAGAKRRTS